MTRGNKTRRRETTAERNRRIERQRAEREAAAKRKKRLRIGIIAAVVVVVIAGGALGGILYLNGKKVPAPAASNGVEPDKGSYSVAMFKPGIDRSKVVRLDVYEDPRGAASDVFETGGVYGFKDGDTTSTSLVSTDDKGKALAGLIDDGKVQVYYHELNFLDTGNNTDYSTRAANAMLCAVDEGKFREVHDALYKNFVKYPSNKATTVGSGASAQTYPPGYPNEAGMESVTNDQILGWAKSAGASSAAFTSCVNGGKYNKFVGKARANGLSALGGKNETLKVPALFINGTRNDKLSTTVSVADLTAAINEASSSGTTPKPPKA